jgi:protein O-GlcNAc transferase
LNPSGNYESLLDRARQAQQANRPREAEQFYRQAILLKPKNIDAIQALGALLLQSGQPAAALVEFARAAEIDPDSPASANNLGIAFQACGQFDKAIQAYRNAVQRHPRFPQLFYNLGVALFAAGKLDDAIAAFEQAVALRSDYAEAYNNLAAAFVSKGDLDRAIATYQHLLSKAPNFAAGHNNLGEALRKKGRFDEAIAQYRRAIAIDPKFSEANYNMGLAFRISGRFPEAIESYRQALAIRPNYPEAWSNLGNAYFDNKDPDHAIEACQKAIELRPDYPDAFNNLGNALRHLGRHREADDAFRRAIALAPYDAVFHSNLLLSMYYFEPDLKPMVQESRRWDEIHARPLRPANLPQPADPDPSRPLRIGYVSADFRENVCAFYIWPLLTHHNRKEFDITCYAQVPAPDAVTHQFQTLPGQWRNIAAASDQQVADQVRQDRIDILVDLKLHTDDNRLLVFARKPAPIQISWLGFPSSPGLSTIDYRLTDRYLEPPGEKNQFPDQPYHLPDCFWCYDPLTSNPPVNHLPALQNGYVTFGCLNSFWKLTEETMRRWAAVLDRLPGSRILLLTPPGSARETARAILGANRVDFIPSQTRDKYLESFHRIDLCLDALPYNGHTTSLDSLWMGVPFVTLVGKTSVGRAGLSFLTNMKMTQLVAKDEAEFVNLAVDWATDLQRLAALRAVLRQRLQSSPLMDASRFAAAIESAYRDIWRTFLAHKKTPGAL